MLNQMLGFGVHTAGRIVEDQDARVADEGARNRNALFLAAAQGYAPFTDFGPIAGGESFDKVVRTCRFRCHHNFFQRRIGATVGDIFGNRRIEEKGILQHRADLAAQTFELQPPHINAINPHRACVGVIETRDQIDDRALARSSRPD